MKIKAVFLAAAVISASAVSLTAFGADDPLDLGLGPKQGPMPAEVKKTDAATDTTTPKATDETAPKTTVKKDEIKTPGGDIISPDATKAVDDQELVKKLTGEDTSGDKVKEVVDHMGQSAERLENKDAGEVTQETQRRIVMDLDVLIEIAKKKQQQQGKSDPSKEQKPGQDKQESQGNQQGKQSQGGNTAATSSQLPGGGSAAAQTGPEISEKSQEWGGLPPRDRDLISHGANEQYLAAYKEQIVKYYQALAEIGKAAREH